MNHNLNCTVKFLEMVPKAMRLIKEEMRGAARDELTVPQFRLFARLARSSATSTELAEWMGIAPPTVSRMVDTLVKRRLVRRVQKTSDRRRVPLQLTEEGKRKYERIRYSVRRKMTKKILALSADQKKELLAGLSVLQEMVP